MCFVNSKNLFCFIYFILFYFLCVFQIRERHNFKISKSYLDSVTYIRKNLSKTNALLKIQFRPPMIFTKHTGCPKIKLLNIFFSAYLKNASEFLKTAKNVLKNLRTEFSGFKNLNDVSGGWLGDCKLKISNAIWIL